MRLLLIHQNFPGQFRQLSRQLMERGHELIAVGRQSDRPLLEGLTHGLYSIREPDEAFEGSDRQLELAMRRGEQVRQASLRLQDQGWIPDAVLFHSSWGEGLYLRDVWPQQRLVAYPELYGTPWVMGYGVDERLQEPPPELCAAMRHRNLLALAAIADSDALVAPTRHQRNTFPLFLRERFEVIHEGIDVQTLAPNPNRYVVLGPDLALRRGDPVVSFCSRHLEPLRGLHTFLHALVTLQRRHPQVQVLIVGDHGRGYGPPSEHPQGHFGALLEELGDQLDLERIHVLGAISHEQLHAVFQVSAAHVYLTYPYALSWSLLEAMACGAPIVGSSGPPVNEVIRNGENGLLVGFNDADGLAQAVLRLLEDPALAARLGQEGRRTVERDYGLQACTDAYEALLSGPSAPLASGESAPAPGSPDPASPHVKADAAG